MNSSVEKVDDEHISPQTLLNSLSVPALLTRRDGRIIRCNQAFLAQVNVSSSQHIEEFLKSAQTSVSLVALVERSLRLSGELPARVQFKNDQGMPVTVQAYLSMVKSKISHEPYAVLIQLRLEPDRVSTFLKRFEASTSTKNALIQRAKADSMTDALTGLKNRRAIEAALSTYLELFQRHKSPCSLALLDIDHFKRINDEFGHQVGDTVISTFSTIMQELVRGPDLVGRWGGEEFIIAMPETQCINASKMVNRLMGATRKVLVKADEQTVSFTFSAGVSQFRAGDSVEALIARVDEALYSAKQAGRNRFRIRL